MSHPKPEATEPRFPAVSRRAFLRRSAAAGLAAAVIPALAACGSSSTSVSAQDNVQSTATGPTTAPTTGPVDPTAVDPTTVDVELAAGTFPASSKMQIDFTYQASGGGRIHSPYIAVWIEDDAGDLVQAVSLWYKSDERKYLRDLKRWSSTNAATAMTTGATRIPGSFNVTWDGTNLDGTLVADGNYFVCIEAAREKGPYQLIRQIVPVSGALAPTMLSPNGELTAAAVRLVA